MAVNTEDLAFLEQTLPFWAELTPAQKALVRKNTIRREYPAGEMLHNGSRDCSGVMVVVSGQLRVYIVSDSARRSHCTVCWTGISACSLHPAR